MKLRAYEVFGPTGTMLFTLWATSHKEAEQEAKDELGTKARFTVTEANADRTVQLAFNGVRADKVVEHQPVTFVSPESWG